MRIILFLLILKINQKLLAHLKSFRKELLILKEKLKTLKNFYKCLQKIMKNILILKKNIMITETACHVARLPP